MTIENWPAVKLNQIAFACEFSGDDVSVVYAYDDHSTSVDPAAMMDCVALWRLMAKPFGVSHLVAQIADQTFAVSGHGNLVFEGRKPINLGLLFASLSELPMELPQPPRDEPAFAQGADAAIWRVLERLARCEAARQLHFEIGTQAVLFNADRSGFEIVSGATDLRDFFDILRTGITSGEQLRYTLGDGRKPENPQTISDALCAIGSSPNDDQGLWSMVAGQWPSTVPSGVNLDQLCAGMRLASCCKSPRFEGAQISLRGYGSDRAKICAGVITENRSVSFSCPN